MSYVCAKDALRSIESRRRNKKDLPAFQSFLKEVCPKAFTLPIIHVAGTNGKGSTVNYLRSQLQALGYRVGTLTSPALYVHYDRIRINDAWMKEDVFLRLVNCYDTRWQALGLAMFDIDVHLAMEWFVEEQVDFVILETGLGGRLDATNVFQPKICAITNIGHDHMQLLGNTLEEIAREKGGIIKQGVPLVTSEKRPSCLEVFKEICREKHAPFYECHAENVHTNRQGMICFESEEGDFITLSTMAGYQAENAALAYRIISLLCPAANKAVRLQAIQNSKWAGRFEIVSKQPLVIIDGAHNREGIEALCTTLQDLSIDTILFSVLKDKEGERMIECLRKVCNQLILCPFQQERLADLSALAKKYQLPLAQDLSSILQQRMAVDQRIVICGSLYFVSEAVKLFQ